MLHKAAPSGAVTKVFIATPTYDSLSAGYTFALFHTAQELEKRGISSELAIYSGDCHVDDARNRLVRDFLETDCTDLVFIDADLRWQPEDFIKLISYDRDVVASTYPLKQDEEKYPVRFLSEEIWSDADGLIEVESVPTGFLRIKRHVLQKLADNAVKFKPKSDNRSDLPLIFERQVHDGMRWGGDYTFCRKWREFGSIYLDPTMWFDHYGESIYNGRCSSWIKKFNGQELPGIEDIINGTDSEAVYTELFNEWGNQWAASPAMLCALAELSRGTCGDILEAGSGLSSLVMAAANPSVIVNCLESNKEWADKVANIASKYNIDNLNIVLSPIENGWYSECPRKDYSLVICDGPPRGVSDRTGIYDYVGNAMFVMDDAEDKAQLAKCKQWAKDRPLHVLGKNRPFVIVEGVCSARDAVA
jgi:predicted O-methyltransferase YrrM